MYACNNACVYNKSSLKFAKGKKGVDAAKKSCMSTITMW